MCRPHMEQHRQFIREKCRRYVPVGRAKAEMHRELRVSVPAAVSAEGAPCTEPIFH